MAHKGYIPLADEDYNLTAHESSLKSLLRVRDPVTLAQNATAARENLYPLQTRILQRAWRYPLRYLPLLLCRGPARSGANFLRWRNQENNRSGTLAWRELMQSPDLPQAVREALLQIEQDRIVFNMQMSIVTFILRQTRECAQKIAEARTLAGNIPTIPTMKKRSDEYGSTRSE
ncbi:DUF3158 family protein [Salmonella enterica subsp. enterica]|nr:DUF3158 family protein [Salmonella enterica subsp. enterica]MIF51092.1 DUF3158 family protein [Salmonella enterica subsp. enterica]